MTQNSLACQMVSDYGAGLIIPGYSYNKLVVTFDAPRVVRRVHERYDTLEIPLTATFVGVSFFILFIVESIGGN